MHSLPVASVAPGQKGHGKAMSSDMTSATARTSGCSWDGLSIATPSTKSASPLRTSYTANATGCNRSRYAGKDFSSRSTHAPALSCHATASCTAAVLPACSCQGLWLRSTCNCFDRHVDDDDGLMPWLWLGCQVPAFDFREVDWCMSRPPTTSHISLVQGRGGGNTAS